MNKLATHETKFEPVPLWAKLPHPMVFKEATSVDVDSQDRVYVFNRGANPVIIFDKDGNFLETWGEGEFDRAHGITVDNEDNLFLVDDLGHFVDKRSRDGKRLMRIGERGKPSPWQGGQPFNRPTRVAIHSGTGDLFISDGYGNSRVHKYDSEGNHILSWGLPGSGPGEFSLPHNIAMAGDDMVVICDRENFRLQFFDLMGNFVKQVHMHRPMSIASVDTDQGVNLYVGEAGAPPVQDGVPNLGLRVVVLDIDGDEITSFGDSHGGEAPNQFLAPHGMAVDSEGSVYIAEVSFTAYGSIQDPPREVVSLRKWRRAAN